MPWFRVSQWWIFELESLRAVLLHSITTQGPINKPLRMLSVKKREVRTSSPLGIIQLYGSIKKKSNAFLMNTRKSTICVQEHGSFSPPPLANSAANGQLHLCTHACTVCGIWIKKAMWNVSSMQCNQFYYMYEHKHSESNHTPIIRHVCLYDEGHKFRHCLCCSPLFQCFIIEKVKSPLQHKLLPPTETPCSWNASSLVLPLTLWLDRVGIRWGGC